MATRFELVMDGEDAVRLRAAGEEALAEIERVIRMLPPMNPATQNGRPVPVVFQLPFRVSRI